MGQRGGALVSTAFIFPGQGSQSVGMGKGLFDAYPEAKAIFDVADDALHEKLSTLCFEGPEDALKQTAQHLQGSSTDIAHFTPSYMPWDQRLCIVPDADLFTALKSGQASVETDQIAGFEGMTVQLRSGKTIALILSDLTECASALQVIVRMTSRSPVSCACHRVNLCSVIDPKKITRRARWKSIRPSTSPLPVRRVRATGRRDASIK